jgi:hypothetical protein
MAGFGNTTNHGIAWNSEEGHSILKRFSEGHDSTPFIRGTEDIKSTPHKAAPQETSGMSPISKNQWKQMEQQISHTHSQNTEIRDLLIVTLGVNCFHSIELITAVSKTRTHWNHITIFIASIATVLMRDFESRRLLLAYAAGILNECEKCGSMRRHEKKPRN